MKELKATDKVTQKMTRDGAVTENLATGEVTNISSREAEVDLSSEQEPAATAEVVAERAAHAHNRHKAKQAARADAETVRAGSEARSRPSSRLQFTEEERAAPDLQKAIRRSDQAADKLDAAKDAIPTKKVLKTGRVFDEAAGKGRTRLRFEEVEKKPDGHLRHNPLSRPVQELKATAHGEVRKVEHENVGVEAGHKGEELAERGVARAAGGVRSAVRERRMKPWRDTVKAEKASMKANAEYRYQKALHDDPGLAASNPVSRYLQKKRIQRNYAKEIRQAEKAAKNTAATTKSAAQKAKDAFKETFLYVKHHSRAVLLIIGIGACVELLFGGMSSCSIMGGSGVSGVFMTSYLSEDADMLAAEADYTDMEAALQNELDNYESYHPGYDEYCYDLDTIGHDPYVLISILSAFHEGVFTIDEVQRELQELFDKQYTLTQTVTVEVRYRTETYTDPETGEESSEEVPYDYYICTVTLENFDLSHLPVYMMDEEQLSLYAAYMSTLGNRPDLFGGGEYPNASTLQESTYYDIPPEALEDETFAAMIAEAEKYLGYPYVWGGSSPSTSFDCSGFVSWVINHSGWNVGRLGAQGLYSICTPVSSSQAKPGDLIFFKGTYDTLGVSHVGIYVGGGMMIHCGSPISYASINTSYWQAHYYSFGRLP
ncbi:MAG: NlpC/P60 family protein [Eubacteriales bacterium]|nr:NlpC/P60 family protein [Eubacteriales bacterium]